MKRLILWVCACLVLMVSSCIDPIEFSTGDEPRRLVVEGLITNNSFYDKLSWPAPPEPFYVALRWTSEVNNEKDEVINDADVRLIDGNGSVYEYIWSDEHERYIFGYPNFAAEQGVSYYLRITLSDGEVYESDIETLHPAPDISSLEVNYTNRLQEIKVGPETEFIDQRGVELLANLPEHSSETYYYRWKVTPSWVYETSLLPGGHPNKTCYVTNDFYFQKINVGSDRTGGYAQSLFFLETDDNDRIEQDFTALITQYSLSPEAYRFWDELALQQQIGGGIFDPPPFPLVTNIRNVNDSNEKVSGFFMVAHESIIRWYINQDELPYELEFSDRCAPIPGVPFIPPKGCANCLEYPGGNTSITNQKPAWWREYE